MRGMMERVMKYTLECTAEKYTATLYNDDGSIMVRREMVLHQGGANSDKEKSVGNPDVLPDELYSAWDDTDGYGMSKALRAENNVEDED
jgi:hypothetical protein